MYRYVLVCGLRVVSFDFFRLLAKLEKVDYFRLLILRLCLWNCYRVGPEGSLSDGTLVSVSVETSTVLVVVVNSVPSDSLPLPSLFSKWIDALTSETPWLLFSGLLFFLLLPTKVSPVTPRQSIKEVTKIHLNTFTLTLTKCLPFFILKTSVRWYTNLSFPYSMLVEVDIFFSIIKKTVFYGTLCLKNLEYIV